MSTTEDDPGENPVQVLAREILEALDVEWTDVDYEYLVASLGNFAMAERARISNEVAPMILAAMKIDENQMISTLIIEAKRDVRRRCAEIAEFYSRPGCEFMPPGLALGNQLRPEQLAPGPEHRIAALIRKQIQELSLR